MTYEPTASLRDESAYAPRTDERLALCFNISVCGAHVVSNPKPQALILSTTSFGTTAKGEAWLKICDTYAMVRIQSALLLALLTNGTLSSTRTSIIVHTFSGSVVHHIDPNDIYRVFNEYRKWEH